MLSRVGRRGMNEVPADRELLQTRVVVGLLYVCHLELLILEANSCLA